MEPLFQLVPHTHRKSCVLPHAWLLPHGSGWETPYEFPYDRTKGWKTLLILLNNLNLHLSTQPKEESQL